MSTCPKATPRVPYAALNMPGPVLEVDPEALTALLKSFSAPLPNLSFASSKAGPLTAARTNVDKPLLCPPEHKLLQASQHSLAPGNSSKSEQTRGLNSSSKSEPEHPRATSQQIIALLTLLDKLDAEVVGEVQRVQENIKETRAEIREYRREKRARVERGRERAEVMKRMTVGADSDFWAGV
ncbi:hypothetical protein OE88DRAFT_1642909 [Heliocybe sulcata]|uniref:Uncharacterized protein n=1 Tax=Heliocybe sulcata TaxID=5364 RepID=A0A5C3NL63_9AGAM|nr:hypothetical protein OE88DRAFT_1642909 [Heliocybe sulcata]